MRWTPTSLMALAVFLAAGPAGGATILFDYSDLSGVGGQDGIGTVDILDGGRTLELTGNRWQALDFAIDVQADTVLSFDYRSAAEGEIHAVLFGTRVNNQRAFQLAGTQKWGLRTYMNYEIGSGWKHYEIPVGSHFTGTFDKLTFVSDFDSGRYMDGAFRDVKVTPEPATLVLLAAGAVVLRRRRA